MPLTVQRISQVTFLVDAFGNANFVWGAAEDGALNGGTSVAATLENSGVNDITLTIYTQAVRGGPFVAYAATVACLAGVTTSVALTSVSGYGMRFEAKTAAGTSLLLTSVQVQA